MVFKIASQNTQLRHFWFQIREFLCCHQTLQLDKFKGVDSKYNNGFSEFQPENTQIKHFLS